MRKRILSLALALATVLVLLPASALAADSDFQIENGVLTKYNGPGGDVTIPDGVTSIGKNAFLQCGALTSVSIPTSVTSIEEAAFIECYSLTSVTIPSSVTSIGDGAFYGCTSLASVTIPTSVTSIGIGAFLETAMPTYIYYGGTEAQLKAVKFGDGFKNFWEQGKVIRYNSPMPNQPQQPAAETVASPTNDKLEVNGNAADPTVYKIGGSNYFKIRDVAALLNGTEKQFSVGYDGEKNAVTATTGQGYDKQSGDLAGAAKGGDQSAAASNDAIYVNGEKITAEVYKIGGSNYFKLRDLGKALNFYVGWSADRGMYIETDKPYSD